MITFYLVHKNRPISPIAMLVCFRGSKYRRLTRESVNPQFWNPTKKRVRVTSKNTEGNITNDLLNKWEAAALHVIAYYKEFIKNPLPEEFFRRLDSEFYHDKSDDNHLYFTDYIKKYIDRYKDSKSTANIRKFNTTLNKLIEYESYKKERLVFESIDIDFYNDFQKWFYSKGFSTNYFGNQIRVIKQIYREARIVDKLHNLTEIDHREFVGNRVDTDSIYLSEDELLKIFNLEISKQTISKYFKDLDSEQIRKKVVSYNLVRERFLIGAYTGLRVSDYNRLGELNISDEFISIRAKKTGKESVIPIHPIVRKILDSGFNPGIKVSDQKINKHIKEIARMAGITQSIIINKHIAGKYKEEVFQKCDLVCTHTARRSFATNAYKAGVPVISIMKITGHTKESVFMKYIKISEEENAELLKKHSFFKDQK